VVEAIMNEIERFEHAGRTVVIAYDEDAESPRTAYDNLATLFYAHRRLTLGDEEMREPLSAKELIRMLKGRGEKVLAILPLFAYEHGGVTMSAGSSLGVGNVYADRFDSGQVGWGVVLASQAEKMGCVGTFTDPRTGKTTTYDRAFFEGAIKGEVSTFDDYLTGQVFGYMVEGRDGEVLDSCWGFYGDLDYVREEARSAAEGTDDPAIERDAEELAARPTFAG
jgi:hypothetical protein